jgi:hypothetical protein
LIGAPIDVDGGSGLDRVVYDTRGETSALNVELRQTEVTGLGLATPGLFTFDDAIEEIELLLGAGDDVVQFGVTPNPIPIDLNRKAIINGGEGIDLFDFAWTGAPDYSSTPPVPPHAETVAVEQIEFESNANGQSANWLLNAGQLRIGAVGSPTGPADYPQVVFNSPDADSIDLRLGDDLATSETLRIWDVPQDTTIDMRQGTDHVFVGSGAVGGSHLLADVLGSLHVSGSLDTTLTVDDTAGGFDRVGSFEAGAINGFGLGNGRLSHSGLAQIELSGSDMDYEVTVIDTSAPILVQLGLGEDVVTVAGTSHNSVILLGDSLAGAIDQAVVHSASAPVLLLSGSEVS